MPHELGELRARMVASYWEYLDQSFNLEHTCPSDGVHGLVATIEQDLRTLNARLARLDARSRDAILAVFNYEVSILVLRCNLEAEHLIPAKRMAGLI